MRNVSLLVILIIVALALAACGDDTSSQPSQLDAPFINTTPTADSTQTPWPTAWATTGPAATSRPSPSPYPTRDRSSATEEPLDDLIVPGDWLSAIFTDSDGQEHTFAEFPGRMVLIHIVSTSCEVCIEQQRELLAAVEDRIEYQVLTNPVIVTLNVDTRTSASLLKTVFQDQLGEDWATIEKVQQNDDYAAEFFFATASEKLLAAIARDFGPDAIEPQAIPIIIIEPDQYAHYLDEGLVSMRDLRDLMTFYMTLNLAE